MNASEYDFVVQAISASVDEQRKQLLLAVNRRKRASTAMQKADHDIAAISGALAALQDVARRLNAPLPGIEKEEAEDRGAAPRPPAPLYQTLAGPVTLSSQPTSDPQES